MYLLGATLTKFLATLAAILTVTAGLPNFQCRCPDGRVMHFCNGKASSPSGCCCDTGSSSSPEAKSCCCEAKKANTREPTATSKRPCCAQSEKPSKDRQQGSDGDSSQLAIKAACCVKSVVAAPVVDSIPTTGSPLHQVIDTLVLWSPALDASSLVFADVVATRPPPRFLATPPDLVVVLCHFTC